MTALLHGEGVATPVAVPAKPLVAISGLHRSFSLGHTTVKALRGVDLKIHAGEMLAVWGPSGSGKSTLMNMIGLIDRPDTGNVCFKGIEVLALSDDELSDCRSRNIGFVFQSFNLVPVLTALENVMLPLQLQGVGAQVARAKAQGLLDAVGLGAHLNHRPDRMSGGQRQRTAIARALVADPELVIADEPTANLDSESSQNVISLMRELNRDTGTTFVFSTHDQRLLDHVPRAVQLRDGIIEHDQECAQ
ncbi:ABC transporter ATP-binding protein [Acidovorax sp. A79]|uniref:ABC transporter ATP-binding protein n=1 Tax=Acidovorax sp. A79 TaxID=3056107 RepID=UPI0034E8A0BA